MNLFSRFARGNEEEPSEEEEQVPYFAAHHTLPFFYHDPLANLPVRLELLPLDQAAASRPVSRGMAPVMHIPLPPPDVLRVLSPYPSPFEAQRMVEEAEAPIHFPKAPPSAPAARPAPSITRVGTGMAAAPAVHQEPTFTRPAILEQFEPFFAYLIYLALGLGTLFLKDTAIRYVVMAISLIGLGGALTLLDARQRPNRLTTSNIIPGLGTGLFIGLIMFIFTGRALAATADILYANVDTAALFQLMAITVPIGETLFFRGVLQNERGFATSVIAAGAASLVLYWPNAIATPIYLVVGAIFSTALAAVYSYIRARYGTASAAACQAVLNTLLIFLPSVLS